MYTPGHVGVALFLYAPFGSALSALGHVQLALVGLAVAAGLSTLPDVDKLLPIQHRGLTHTVWFGSGVALASVPVAILLQPIDGDTLFFGTFVGFVVLLSVCSHLLADSITPMGIRPFAPVSDRHYSLAIVPAKHRVANAVLFSVGCLTVLVAVIW